MLRGRRCGTRSSGAAGVKASLHWPLLSLSLLRDLPSSSSTPANSFLCSGISSLTNSKNGSKQKNPELFATLRGVKTWSKHSPTSWMYWTVASGRGQTIHSSSMSQACSSVRNDCIPRWTVSSAKRRMTSPSFRRCIVPRTLTPWCDRWPPTISGSRRTLRETSTLCATLGAMTWPATSRACLYTTPCIFGLTVVGNHAGTCGINPHFGTCR